uniref:Adaptinlike protein putative n=1 Tax=Albugo laibachii Nc14 TaxID=890382 RepID=F0X0Z2_9STRA|nr:adaptinlike protein putative [Albugo laibachii Nc14]|eukprot:CCA27438.1 adaptinlike protein putative [Albugo laibachii Nc14]
MIAADSENTIEQIIFTERGVWFYHIASNYISTLEPRADQWDPEHPFMTGSAEISQRGDECVIRLYEPIKDLSHKVLFAECPVRITRECSLGVYVQDCIDSSRYFMIRVEDRTSKRRAFVGIGFPERSSAFNFKAALQGYAKYQRRQTTIAAAESSFSEVDVDTQNAPNGSQKCDYKLPQGARIHLKLKNNNVLVGSDTEDKRKAVQKMSIEEDEKRSVSLKSFAIPPPPSTSAFDATQDDEWGQFTAA